MPDRCQSRCVHSGAALWIKNPFNNSRGLGLPHGRGRANVALVHALNEFVAMTCALVQSRPAIGLT